MSAITKEAGKIQRVSPLFVLKNSYLGIFAVTITIFNAVMLFYGISSIFTVGWRTALAGICYWLVFGAFFFWAVTSSIFRICEFNDVYIYTFSVFAKNKYLIDSVCKIEDYARKVYVQGRQTRIGYISGYTYIEKGI
jgi:hypothetical protein